MRPRRVSGLLAAFVVLLAVLPLARANRNVKKLIADLTESDDKKVRLSAANSLAKIGADDEDAINAFIGVLVGNDDYTKDKDKTVRGTAAVGLGKVVTADTEPDLIDAAVEALTKASTKDKDKFVKKQAKKALGKVQKLQEEGDDGGGSDGGGGDGIYVDIGKMAAETDNADELKARMKKVVETTLKAKTDFQYGSGKKAPKGMSAFHVDGTVNSVTVKAQAGGNKVSCKVSMLIASYPSKSIFGLLDGKGAVMASDDEADIAAATKDCVNAVVEDLTIKKIIPTIKSKAGG